MVARIDQKQRREHLSLALLKMFKVIFCKQTRAAPGSVFTHDTLWISKYLALSLFMSSHSVPPAQKSHMLVIVISRLFWAPSVDSNKRCHLRMKTFAVPDQTLSLRRIEGFIAWAPWYTSICFKTMRFRRVCVLSSVGKDLKHVWNWAVHC